MLAEIEGQHFTLILCLGRTGPAEAAQFQAR